MIANDFRKIVAPIRQQLVKKYNSANLECKCAIASQLIWKALNKRGYQAIFAIHRGRDHQYSPNRYTCHCFVLCNDYLIDITATQFMKVDKVLVKKHRHESYWMISQTANTLSGIKELLSSWPPEQQLKKF